MRSLDTIARTAAGRVIGGCNGCGTGIAVAGTGRDITVTCPGCGTPVELRMVSGRMADEECDSTCLYAKGPLCVCTCGGDNHGHGYDTRLVATWVAASGAEYPTVEAPEVPAHIVRRNQARHAAVVLRRVDRIAAKQVAADAYRAGLLADYPELLTLLGERFAGSDSGFVLDMRRKITAGEELTPNMIDACVRAVTSTLERDARRATADAVRAAALAAGVRVEPGRQVITGEIVWLDMNVPIPFKFNGTRAECIVRDAAGRRYKGTFPAALEPVWAREIADAFVGWPDRARGQRVTIVATVKPSDRDQLMGFFSRPTVPAGTPTLSHIGPAGQAPDSTTPPAVAPTRAPRPARCHRDADPSVCQHTPGCFPAAPAQLATAPATPLAESFVSPW